MLVLVLALVAALCRVVSCCVFLSTPQPIPCHFQTDAVGLGYLDEQNMEDDNDVSHAHTHSSTPQHIVSRTRADCHASACW